MSQKMSKYNLESNYNVLIKLYRKNCRPRLLMIGSILPTVLSDILIFFRQNIMVQTLLQLIDPIYRKKQANVKIPTEIGKSNIFVFSYFISK